MPISYFLDRSATPCGTYHDLPDDFVQTFVAHAQSNGTFGMYTEQDRPGLIFMRGTDDQNRRLVGVWSKHPAYVLSDGQRMVVFKDIAENLPFEQEATA